MLRLFSISVGYTAGMIKLGGMVRLTVAVAMVPLMAVQPSFGWGADGHSMINRLAAANLQIGDSIASRLRNIGVSALREDADRIRPGEQSSLKNLAAEQRRRDIEAVDRSITIERIAGSSSGIHDQIIGVDTNRRRNENRVSGEIDECHQPRRIRSRR
jgi:hypothetical protein